MENNFDHKAEYLNCIGAIIEKCEQAYLAGIKQGKKLESSRSDSASVMLHVLESKQDIVDISERLTFIIADAVLSEYKIKQK